MNSASAIEAVKAHMVEQTKCKQALLKLVNKKGDLTGRQMASWSENVQKAKHHVSAFNQLYKDPATIIDGGGGGAFS